MNSHAKQIVILRPNPSTSDTHWLAQWQRKIDLVFPKYWDNGHRRLPLCPHHHHHHWHRHRHRDTKCHPAVVICHQNDLSSTSSITNVTSIPMSQQIWWIQVVGGRPRAHLQSGDTPSQQVKRIWFSGTSSASLAMCLNKLSLHLRTIDETARRPVRRRTSSLEMSSYHLMWRIRHWHRVERIQLHTIELSQGPRFQAVEKYSGNCLE